MILDQSFTVDNLRYLFDYANRKGGDLEKRFFSQAFEVSIAMKRCNEEYRILSKSRDRLTSDEFISKRNDVNLKKQELRKRKKNFVDKDLKSICDIISKKDFRISIHKKERVSSKPVYAIDKTVENYFLAKHTQRMLRKLYKVKQNDRFVIVSQLYSIVNDNFPKCILRIDIKNFYESISHELLLQRLDKDGLLSFELKRHLQHLFSQYVMLAKTVGSGLPRGLGVSAYLSEIFMKDLDAAFHRLENVIYYARYVDDIVVVFTPSNSN